jgi:hypothetical protein
VSNRKKRRMKRKAQRMGQKVVKNNDEFGQSLIIAHERAKKIIHPQKEAILTSLRELIAMYHNAWSPDAPPPVRQTEVPSIITAENPPGTNERIKVREVK